MKKIIMIAIILIATSNFAGLWNNQITGRIYNDMDRVENLASEIKELICTPDNITVGDSIVYIISPAQKQMLRNVVMQKFLLMKAIVDTICIDYGIE